MPSNTEVVNSNLTHGEVLLMQHYVMKSLSDLRQDVGFIRVFWFPPPIKIWWILAIHSEGQVDYKLFLYENTQFLYVLLHKCMDTIANVSNSFQLIIFLLGNWNKDRFLNNKVRRKIRILYVIKMCHSDL
jgi:hypothetical protein